MDNKTKKAYLRPEDVEPARAKRVLSFLNTVAADEIADAIEFPGERDVGIKVAQNILARRVQLGGFKNLRQVAAVPQVGLERFTEIVNALAIRKKMETSYTIEGQIKVIGKIDFRKEKLAVHAFVGGVEMACADVNTKGSYKLAFYYKDTPSTTELRVLPAKFSHRCSQTLTLSKTISPSRYVLKERTYRAIYDLLIPPDYLTLWGTVTTKYRMHGTVWATTFSGGIPISIEPLPAAKIEFHEVDALIFWLLGTEPELTEGYLGYAYTALDGSYDFEFDFSYKTRPPWIWLWLFTDRVPDIRARISQFIDGLWQQVYEGPVDWNIVEDFHRDYFIPVEDTIPIPDEGVKPDEGFRFVSVGLLPVDETRIQQGYATAQPGDPGRIVGISHQPFCGTLRIFGLFAEAPPVASYKAQIVDADEDGPTSSNWQDITDPLHNRKWNNVENCWEHMVLGPDPATGRYQNIDTQAEADWHEHALKITWNSTNEANGYYALRIIGYDADNAEVGTFEMPVVRVDNDVPEASIEVMGSVTECGALQLGADRKIQFKVTAHDPEGHVLRYWLSGTRGKGAGSAGNTVQEWRPDPPGDVWTGVKNHIEDFTVAALTGDIIGCPSVAYNFELHVWGLATDCYNVTPGLQRIKRETNLIVSEP